MAQRSGSRTPAGRPFLVGALALGFAATTACGADGLEVDLAPAGALPAPTFVSVPDDLADSPQLAALVVRDTAGLLPDVDGARVALLQPALAALAAIDNPPRDLFRLSIYADSVNMSFPENGNSRRSIGAYYSVGFGPGELTVGTNPEFTEEATFPIGPVDPGALARIVAAIIAQGPGLVVTNIDLDRDLSYGFGLVWHLRVADSRGSLATVFADLDGAIVAVDLT